MNSITIGLFSIKLQGLALSVLENSLSNSGAIKGIPPGEFNYNYSQSQKIYKGKKFDRRSQIYGTKRKNK